MTIETKDAGLSATVNHFIERYFAMHGDVLPADGLYHRILREVEKPLIEQTLKAVRYNQVKAAKILGINRNTLRKKISDLGITLS